MSASPVQNTNRKKEPALPTVSDDLVLPLPRISKSSYARNLQLTSPNRTLVEYAYELGLSVPELLSIVQNKKTLVLGASGVSFGTSVLAVTGPEHSATQIYSLSSRFSSPLSNLEREQILTAVLKIEDLLPTRSRPSLEKIQSSYDQISLNLIGLDWKNLERLNPSKKPFFDLILSVWAFPVFSDFSFEQYRCNPKSRGRQHIRFSHNAHSWFGKESKVVFDQCCTLLKPGGKGIFLMNEHLNASMEAKPKFIEGLNTFFKTRSCKLSVVKGGPGMTRLELEKS